MVKEFFQRLFFSEQTDAQPRTMVIHSKGIGSTGSENYAGYPQEEYLNTLQGVERAKLFDKMRRSDPQIKMCLSAVKSPLKSALWSVKPANQDDELAKRDAELVEWVLFHGMDKSFNQFLSEALTFIEHGYSAFEVIDRVSFNHPKFGNINSIKNLAFRSQKTIERWNLNKETDALLSVTQYASGDLDRTVDIPSEFLLVFTLDKEGSNYEGISALRCCYGNWYRKNVYLKLNAIGIEKFAIPTPIVTVPNGKESGEQFENMIAALEAYVGHEKNYLTKPEGWEVDLNTNTYDPQKVEVSIDNEDKRMVKSFMANFLELGINGFGSQSLSFDLSDFFLGSIEHVALLIAEEINRVLIPRIIQMNYGPRAEYPKICVTGISDRAGKEFADIMGILTEKKVIQSDDNIEEYVRSRYSLPEKEAVVIPEGGAVEDVQKTALNGAQVSSLIQIVQSVASGLLPRDSGIEMIVNAFGVTKDEAEKIMSNAGAGFSINPSYVSTPKLSERVKWLRK